MGNERVLRRELMYWYVCCVGGRTMEGKVLIDLDLPHRQRNSGAIPLTSLADLKGCGSCFSLISSS